MRNETIFQFFHWYISPRENLWNHAKDQAPYLASLGVTMVWLPPAYKSAKGQNEPGYAVYDLYDLGEFDQKNTVRTRYGTKQEYLDCIAAFHANGIQVLADIVFNHKMGGDGQETVRLQKVDPENRNAFAGDPYEAVVNTRYSFPGRQGKYSGFVWTQAAFTGTDNQGEISMLHHEHSQGKWDDVPGKEKGNYDYLMGDDVEFRNPAVREELKQWGKWYVETTGVDGFRIDGLKHIPANFFPEWIDFVNTSFSKSFVCIGEFWENNENDLLPFIEATQDRIQLFDVPLHFRLQEAAEKGRDYDLPKIFDGVLSRSKPERAITFVDNHDTQPLQALQSPIADWFKPIAYAIILLRQEGIPCVFYPCIYGAAYQDEKEGKQVNVELKPLDGVATMMQLRKAFTFGEQVDYFDHGQVIGWVRRGSDAYKNSGCAIVISTGGEGRKKMNMGKQHAGKTMYAVVGNRQENIKVDAAGEVELPVNAGSVSVWSFVQMIG